MIISWFSCGITSAVACKLALEMYSNVELYYIETGAAHEDNKRFISDCENWYGQKINIVQNSKGYKNPIDVINKTGFVNSPYGAECTKSLKKEVRFELEKKFKQDLFSEKVLTNQVFGFEFEEKQVNRAIRFFQQYRNSNPLFPLIEKGLDKNNCAGMLLSQGIEIPTMYKLGYNNNNCIGCVKGGKGYWNKIREDFPEIFEEMKQAEIKAGHSCIKNRFLWNLSKEEGYLPTEIMPNCANFCEIEFADIPDKNLIKVMKGKMSIYSIC